MQGLLLHSRLMTPAKSWESCLTVGEATLPRAWMTHIYSWQGAISLISFFGAISVAALKLTLSSYGVALPVQPANSSHTIMSLETNLCHVFGFLDHLQSDNRVSFTDFCTKSCWAHSTMGWWSRCFMDLPHSLPSIGIWYYWAFKQPSQKLTQKDFSFHLPYLFFVHIPYQGSLVIECGCPQKGIISFHLLPG